MLWGSVHALVILLYPAVIPGNVYGTTLDSVMRTEMDGGSHHFVNQINVLVEKINKQDGRLQTMETVLAEHTVALAEKGRRIVHLENELADIKSREATSYKTSQTTLSKGRNIGDEPETYQSGKDQHITDPNRRNGTIHNGSKQENPARSRTIQQRYEFDIENDRSSENTAPLGVNFKRRQGKQRDSGKRTEIGTPLTTVKLQEQRVDNTSPTGYAFSLSLSGNTFIVQREIIKYDHVLLDTGNGYNHGNGIYQVPASGVYVFTWSTTSDTNDGGATRMELVVNGVAQLPMTVYGNPHSYESATGLMVIHVNVGDHIYIRSMSIGQIISIANGKSTFSGWRLF